MKNIRTYRFVQCIAVVTVFGMLTCAGSTKRKEVIDEQDQVKLELGYGRLLAVEIIKKYPLLNNDRAVRYINKIGKSVAMFAGRSDIDYFFAVLDTDAVNAFATPGGYVFITRGAIKNAKNEAEIAGVLAHEIAHINLKHIMKELPPPREKVNVADIIAALLVSQGATASAAMNETVGKAAELLFKKGYKVNDEYEADMNAVNFTSETGYYPAGLRDYLVRMEDVKKTGGAKEVYHTHPATGERINRLNRQLGGGFNMNKPKNPERFTRELAGLK